MKIVEDIAIVLNYRDYTEKSTIVRCFLKEHGIMAGLCRGSNRKYKQFIVAGSIVSVKWQSRLEDQLGFFTMEPIASTSTLAFYSQTLLYMVRSILDLCTTLLRERDPHPKLFSAIVGLFKSIDTSTEIEVLQAYALLEFILLEEVGFGMELDKCAVTNSTANLEYISPKTGRTVSLDVGKPYHDKLFPMPAFLRGGHRPCLKDIVKALDITGYFLNKWVLAPLTITEPVARIQFIEHLKGKRKEY